MSYCGLRKPCFFFFFFMVRLLLDAESYVSMCMVGPVVRCQLIVHIVLKIEKKKWSGAFKYLI